MRKQIRQAMLLGALLLASALAHAQYAWIDERGIRQYSDQPPPTNTPDDKILKTPRGMERPASASTPVSAAAPKAATWTDREADYRARQAKKEEDDKKAASEKQAADAKRTQCEAAAKSKQQLTSGRPVRSEGRAVMTGADKARELGNIATVLKDCQ
jgi:hypothetical protein